MGNTVKFDRQNVVDKATDLYWKNGFHATSMRNLQDVINMRPGSIYSAFGNKEGLFKEALENYTQLGLAALAQCRATHHSPMLTLKNFVKELIIESPKNKPSAMCMLAKTIAELTDEHGELLAEAKKSFRIFEQAFMSLIIEAQTLGEIDKSKDASRLASFVQIQISGLRIYAKASDYQLALDEIIEDLFTHHPF